MTKEQYPEFLRMVYKLANCYGKEINDDLVDGWWEVFKSYDIFYLGVAFIEVLKVREYFPKPTHIIPLCTKAYRDYSTKEERLGYIKARNIEKPFGKPLIGQENVKKIRQ